MMYNEREILEKTYGDEVVFTYYRKVQLDESEWLELNESDQEVEPYSAEIFKFMRFIWVFGQVENNENFLMLKARFKFDYHEEHNKITFKFSKKYVRETYAGTEKIPSYLKHIVYCLEEQFPKISLSHYRDLINYVSGQNQRLWAVNKTLERQLL